MTQLNIYLAPADDLKGRLDVFAAELGTTPNTLARLVVDEFLESYVRITTEVEAMKRQSFDDLHSRLRMRAEKLGMDRIESDTPRAVARQTESEIRMPRKRSKDLVARQQRTPVR
jgi:urate oxidase